MKTTSWYPSEGDATAEFDQVLAAGLEQLRTCDSFVVVAGHLDETAIYGVRVQMLSGVQTPFAPHFLSQVSSLVARLPVDAMDDMIRHLGSNE